MAWIFLQTTKSSLPIKSDPFPPFRRLHLGFFHDSCPSTLPKTNNQNSWKMVGQVSPDPALFLGKPAYCQGSNLLLVLGRP